MMDKITEEDKVKSAYALNLCTVSVSQIVDYDDLNVLEQEYDAILNNLNLEKIIKNDSLLNVLKQILDTITYFKMENIEKKIIEKEYQQQMKNAIWSAVPNFGLIVAGGSPLTMAISLASQVGIGYMNYRKNKNQYAWDKEKKMMKLQQAAMEQLNGLRRELFTTAWNLAEKYEFPDELRLTEKQIKQYNDILNDPDPIRKYERLTFIKDNFNAYPPFWYFYGSTANYIANAKNLEDTNKFTFELSDKTRQTFRQTAIMAFEKYDELDKFNVLREDQITSSFALEYADLLIADNNPDKDKIKGLIDRAAKMSPNAYDVLELCSITYLRINDRVSAVPLLRFLVNEDYNKVVNGQLLSSIYVNERKIEDYEVLKTRVGTQYLFPMPREGQSLEEAQAEFVLQQKKVLKQKYSHVIDELVEKYSIQWNKIHSTFDYSTEYDDSFFANTRKGEDNRFASASKIFSQEDTKAAYVDKLRNQNTQLCMIDVLNDSVNGLFSLPGLNDPAIKETVIDVVKSGVAEKKDLVASLLDKANSNSFELAEYKQLQDFSFENLYGQIIPNLKKRCNAYVEYIDPKNLSNEEGKLRYICNKEKIKDPEIALGEKPVIEMNAEAFPFTPEIFGAGAIISQKKTEKINVIASFAKDFVSKITPKDESLQIYVKGDVEFERYFNNPIFNEHADIKAHAIVIFDDKSKPDLDLIFTTEGVVSVKKGKVKTLTPYAEVQLEKDTLIVYNDNFFTEKEKFKSTALDSRVIYDLVKKLSDKFEKKVSDNLEFIDNLDGKIVSNWFKAHSNKFDGDVRMAIAYPTSEIISKFGFNSNVELSTDNHLLQFIYDEKSSYILAFRIIEYKNINTNLQAQLEENSGILSFKKA